MVMEIAQFTIPEEHIEQFAAVIQQGAAVIRQAEGCLGVQASQSIEDPSIFVLMIRWRKIEDHTVTFRQGPLFAEYRQHIAGLFTEQPTVRHFPIDE